MGNPPEPAEPPDFEAARLRTREFEERIKAKRVEAARMRERANELGPGPKRDEMLARSNDLEQEVGPLLRGDMDQGLGRSADAWGWLPSGCTPRLALGLGVILILLIFGWVLLFGKDDEGACPPGSAPGATCVKTAKPSGESATPRVSTEASVDAGPSAFTDLSGHWRLSEGLRDPDGLDQGYLLRRPEFTGTITLGPSSASFDIGPDGTVTGGAYDTSHTQKEFTCTRHITLIASKATGSFHADGFGQVTFAGTQSSNDSCREGTGHTDWPLTLYFFRKGDQLRACRLLAGAQIPKTTPTSCAGGARGPAGTFVKS